MYGCKAAQVELTDENQLAIAETAKKYGSWEYLYGAALSFSFSCEGRYPWGGIQLELNAKQGLIEAVRVYSDAMDWTLPEIIEKALTGCRFTLPDMQAAIRAAVEDGEFATDICVLLSKQQI